MGPLFINDQINLIEDYIDDDKQQQENFIKLLDCFFEERDFDSFLSRFGFSAFSQTKSNKLSSKSVLKLAKRLTQKYKIQSSNYSNIDGMQKLNQVRCVINSKYSKKEMSEDLFDEEIDKIIGNNQW